MVKTQRTTREQKGPTHSIFDDLSCRSAAVLGRSCVDPSGPRLFFQRWNNFSLSHRMGEGRGEGRGSWNGFPRASRAFTLIEIMVVVVLLSVIVLGLMAMFDQVQKAFRAGMAQTDQMEGARMFNDLLLRDVEQLKPSDLTNIVNFMAQIPSQSPAGYIPNNYIPMQQNLPASSSTHTNILEDLYFVSRANQTWSGIGYFVRTNPGVGAYVDSVGTLYRFQTNVAANFGDLQPAYQQFLSATNNGSAYTTNPPPISKILDGVVDFQIHCYDTNGVLISQTSNINYPSNFVNVQNWTFNTNDIRFYAFSNNIVPGYVEVELGILEPAVLKRYNSIPDPTTRANFLVNHAGNVMVFRQRIPIRNVDPSAY